MAPAFSKIALLGLAATASISALPVNEQSSAPSQVAKRPNGEHVLVARQGHMGDFSSGVSPTQVNYDVTADENHDGQIDKKRRMRRAVAKMPADYYESSASDNEDGVLTTIRRTKKNMRRSRKRAEAGALTSNDDTPDLFTSHPENDIHTKNRRSSLKKRSDKRDTTDDNIDKYGTDDPSSSDKGNTDVDWTATWAGECDYYKCYSDDGKPHGNGGRVKKRNTDETLKQSPQALQQQIAPLKKKLQMLESLLHKKQSQLAFLQNQQSTSSIPSLHPPRQLPPVASTVPQTSTPTESATQLETDIKKLQAQIEKAKTQLKSLRKARKDQAADPKKAEKDAGFGEGKTLTPELPFQKSGSEQSAQGHTVVNVNWNGTTNATMPSVTTSTSVPTATLPSHPPKWTTSVYPSTATISPYRPLATTSSYPATATATATYPAHPTQYTGHPRGPDDCWDC
ncbi:hypothetical protein HII31_00227 [Pseudocercospora fuligena]|uniref:Uncharacterized protein n=1 Tax=Pseudocercospora fuligena TaxID=685502 RepID=A0A8H6RX67_9PEZI|nr:hypothetical protein HII31_00227 [Pseudocercospora fuligena]